MAGVPTVVGEVGAGEVDMQGNEHFNIVLSSIGEPLGSHGTPPWDPIGLPPQNTSPNMIFTDFHKKHIPKCDFIGIL